MSVLRYEDYIGTKYLTEKGILVTIFSQPFALRAGDNKYLSKTLLQDRYGSRSDVDAEYLRDVFFTIPGADVRLKNQHTTDEIKKYIQDLGIGNQKDSEKYDVFFFVFLTYLACENTGSTVYRDERVHLYDKICPMQEFYDEVKKVDGLQMKPKIFLVQADDVSLLFPIQYIKGGPVIKPFKIPQDADRLIVMSDIPQRFANRDMKAPEKYPSFMIKAFCDAVKENRDRNQGERQDLLSLTTVINAKVGEMIEALEAQEVDRASDMNVPLVTTTLTKLLEI